MGCEKRSYSFTKRATATNAAMKRFGSALSGTKQGVRATTSEADEPCGRPADSIPVEGKAKSKSCCHGAENRAKSPKPRHIDDDWIVSRSNATNWSFTVHLDYVPFTQDLRRMPLIIPILPIYFAGGAFWHTTCFTLGKVDLAGGRSTNLILGNRP